ncbi:MAG: hypothetical protein LBQ48_05060 [Oscillospiraceae bacterium]|jgi:hypothetical protein|nr:hypothetical protein [Oscillospiraceae bacterium]
MIYIIGIVCFILGGSFGAVFMALFAAGSRADDEMENTLKGNINEGRE